MWITIIILVEALCFNCISATASDIKDMMDTINPETAYCEFSAMDGVEGNVLIVLISKIIEGLYTLVGKLKRGVQLITGKYCFRYYKWKNRFSANRTRRQFKFDCV